MGKISKMLPSTDEKVRNVELIYKNIDQGKRASTYKWVEYTTITGHVQRTCNMNRPSARCQVFHLL